MFTYVPAKLPLQIPLLSGCCDMHAIMRSSDSSLQARGKFGLRTRQVTLEAASFVVEAEQQLLGGALAEWQRKAEGDVGAAALNARVAERRLLHASAR